MSLSSGSAPHHTSARRSDRTSDRAPDRAPDRAGRTAGHRWPWFSLLAAVLVLGAVFATPVPAAKTAEVADGLPTSSQTVQAYQREQGLPTKGVQAAVVVFSRTDGAKLTTADDEAIERAGTALAPLSAGGRLDAVQRSDAGTVALLAVPFAAADDDAAVAGVKRIRGALAGVPDGLRAQVTGGPAFTADLTAVFDGADLRLLLVTLGVVALLLLVTYRSPLLWLVPLIVVGAAEQATRRLVDQVLPRLDLAVSGDVTGITSVLVFGAATDYALLLIARYREELRREPDRFAAMSLARRGTREAILASGGTVVLAVLTLTLSDLAGQRALGIAAAIGVVVAVVSALVVLPALLAVCGRALFWPFVPRVGDPAREGRVWGRLGLGVQRRPRLVALVSVLLLAGLATGALGLKIGLSQSEQFRVKPEAVLGAQTLARAFPAGASQPLQVFAATAAVERVRAAAATVPGVMDAQIGSAGGGFTEIDVVLRPEPGTAASDTAVRAVRSAVAAVPGSGAVVGGPVAKQLDVKAANERNLKVILPVILVLVGAVLILLLRSLVAPLLLVLTVIASYFASLGASWLASEHLFGFPAFDTPVVLLSFVFLVALGVDYNIFLVTRAREALIDPDEGAAGSDLDARSRAGMLGALRVTGGVITSAGILLAAVFAVLGVLPLVTLTQVGIIVCLGVLLDTLVVRTVLVPALAFWLGHRFWWPAARS